MKNWSWLWSSIIIQIQLYHTWRNWTLTCSVVMLNDQTYSKSFITSLTQAKFYIEDSPTLFPMTTWWLNEKIHTWFHPKRKKGNTDKKKNKVISYGLQRLKRVLPAQQWDLQVILSNALQSDMEGSLEIPCKSFSLKALSDLILELLQCLVRTAEWLSKKHFSWKSFVIYLLRLNYQFMLKIKCWHLSNVRLCLKRDSGKHQCSFS